MTKRKIPRTADLSNDYFGGPISLLIRYLEDQREKACTGGWENVTVHLDAGYELASFWLEYESEETDGEYQKRLKEEREFLEAKKRIEQDQKEAARIASLRHDKERAEYERLKKKFEGK